jgi:O-acetylserine/cysteine efflux transporter
MPPRHLLLALGIVAVWGTNFVALKWSLEEVPPFLLTAFRYILTAFPAIFFIPWPKGVSWQLLALNAFFVGVLQFSFAYTGLKLGMPGGLSSLVIQTQVFFTTGLAIWLLAERPSLLKLLGAVIGFAGIGVIAIERFEATALFPLLLMLASAFCWSVSNIITKKAGDTDMLAVVVWTSVFVPMPMIILSLLFEGGFGVFTELASNITWRGVLSMFFTALLSTLFGYGAWAVLLSKYPASTVAPFTLLVPIFGFGSTALLLGERITALEVVGSIVAFIGLLISVFGPRLWARQAASTA